MPTTEPTDQPKKGGNPHRTDWQERFLEAYARLGVIGSAAAICRVSRSTIQRERQRDETFALRCAEAHEEAIDVIEDFARRWATTGVPVKHTETRTKVDARGNVIEETTVTKDGLELSPTMAIFMLKTRRPNVYGDRMKVEHGGSPLKVEVTHIDEIAAAARADLARLADRGDDDS